MNEPTVMNISTIPAFLFALIYLIIPFLIFWWARKMIHLKKENNYLLRKLIDKIDNMKEGDA
jgi:ACR3 family arsenite efflux pump ArsB